MWDPWSLDLELPFVAKLKHKSKRSVWETAEHLKGQVWSISHCVLLNLLLSYSSYLYQLLGRLKWAVFSLFYVFFLCHFHFVHTMPCISDKLHVLISPGLSQNRWQVLVYYGSITLQMLYYHAGSAVRLEFHWLVQNCNVLSRPCRFCRADSVSCVLPARWLWLEAALFLAGWCRWLDEVRLLGVQGHLTSETPLFSWKVALNTGCNYRSLGQYDCL